MSDGTIAPAEQTLVRRFGLQNWKVSARLVALIVIPTVVAGVLAGLRVSSALGTAAAYDRVEQVAMLGDRVSALTHALQAERDMAAFNVAERGGSAEQQAALKRSERQADTAITAVQEQARKIDDSYPDTVRAQVDGVVTRLNQLPAVRHVATETNFPPDTTIDKYAEFIDELINLDEAISQGNSDAELAQTARSLAALARAKEDSSEERGYLAAALASKSFLPNTFDAFQAVRAQRDTDIAEFTASATPAQVQFYNDTVAGPQIDEAELIHQEAVNRAGDSPDLSLRGVGFSAQKWYDDMTYRDDRMRAVEDRLVKSLVDRSGHLEDKARRSALLVGGLLLLVLLLVVLAVVIVARSLVGPLHRLRSGALHIAGNRLPDIVRQLRDPNVSDQSFDVAPIDVHSTDEIGEVARAFDEVHREAVRLASNEALLRGNFNAMFVNLSRRSQSLIERQLRLIEDLEQSEQDSARLESLFKLDHLATRMRRNCENLLVLGGQEQARRWNKPVPLVDIIRASLSEVEAYERITLRVQDDVSVVGRVVNDLVHLLAELVENATTFSPEHTKVAVSGHLLSGGGAMIQISDSGVGMSPVQLDESNWRLANPPTIDVSVSRRMGLFVVARLAQRHGVRVELRAALSGGLTAFVILPPTAMHDANAPAAPPPLDSAADLPQALPASRPVARSSTARSELTRMEETPAAAPVPETPREPARPPAAPLPKRKPVSTPPPGRGTAPTAPARSAPQRSPSPPPPSRPAGRPPATTGSAFGESSMARENNGRSPIFEAMQSEWFQRRKTGSTGRADSPPPREWSSPGDEGWRAAETIRSPATGGQTNAGLPKRVPGSNRIPGSVGPAPVASSGASTAEQPAQRPAHRAPEAEAVRNRFSSFQQGVRKGRAATRPEDDERENQ
jgi:signal transduction histidine kinase